MDGTRVERAILRNGLTLVVERMPHFPSVTAGVWVKRGSRQESPALHGASHFVEHLVFKGTPSRTYTEIYKTFDRMGGVLDAFTSREIMGFYFRVQKAHFPEAFEVLCDMLVNATFPEEEMERERGVILEEISMINDTPSDLAGDLFLERAYPSHPLGRPIQGTTASVSAMTRRRLLHHYRTMIQPQNLVVTATGDTSLREIRDQVLRHLGGLTERPPKAGRAPAFRPGQGVQERDHLEQAQIVLGFEAPAADGPSRHTLMVLANCLGGTMSSRLFTEIREKRGLVYSISAEHMLYTDTGLFTIQAASSHDKARRTVEETLEVLAGVVEGGLAEEEVALAKENLLGGLILSLESPASRMGRLARNELYFGRQKPVEEALEGMRKVTAAAVVRAARRLFVPGNGLVFVLGRKSALRSGVLGNLERT
ncbi:MAG: pitrilysin family protein [Acidobacteriota bacterium]